MAKPKQNLVKCKVCGSTLPQKPLKRGDNLEIYGYDKGPIVHNHWTVSEKRGVENEWCPGGGL